MTSLNAHLSEQADHRHPHRHHRRPRQRHLQHSRPPRTVTEPATHPALADRTWTYSYDAADNPTPTLQPGNVRINRQFDQLGRLTVKTGTGAEAATTPRSFGYDLADR
ncbi:hypothetical protein Misp01_70150 [Microtetraspora sp. NBRC 13810]|nr:hypothetical protein Misp01_70150 [Microtetraspora sp. NBRC 13810]